MPNSWAETPEDLFGPDDGTYVDDGAALRDEDGEPVKDQEPDFEQMAATHAGARADRAAWSEP